MVVIVMKKIHNSKVYKYFSSESGLALPLAILVMLITIITTGAMMMALNNEFGIRKKAANMIDAKYISEAGIEHGVFAIQKELIELSELEDAESIEEIRSQLVNIYGEENIPAVITLDEEIPVAIRANPSAVLNQGDYRYCVAKGQLAVTVHETIIEEIIGDEIVERSIYWTTIDNHDFTLMAEGKKSGSSYIMEADVSFSEDGSSYSVSKWTKSKAKKLTCALTDIIIEDVFMYGTTFFNK